MVPNKSTKPHGVSNATSKARPKTLDSSWVLPIIGFAIFTSMDAFRNFQMLQAGALMCLAVNFVFDKYLCDESDVNSLRRCIGCLRIMFFMSIVYYGHAFVGLMSKGLLPGFVPYVVTGLNSLAALVTVACFWVIRGQEKIAKKEIADSSDADGKSEDVAADENDEGDGKDE